MRTSLRRQLPGLLIILPLVAPGYYLQLSYGRYGPYPRWGQFYMQGLLSLITIGALTLVIYGIHARRAELRFRREHAEAAVRKALSPDGGPAPPAPPR
jgi:hypothetical protein